MTGLSLAPRSPSPGRTTTLTDEVVCTMFYVCRRPPARVAWCRVLDEWALGVG